MFELETQNGGITLSTAAVTVKNELVKVWEHAGYGDILKDPSNILRQITSLHERYKKLTKIPAARRSTESFKKKEEEFTNFLENLFDVTVKSLQTSGLITAEDRDFLLHHWDKTISSTRDFNTKQQVEKRLCREEKYQKFSSSNSTPQPSTPDPGDSTASTIASPDSAEEFTPKRLCTSRPTGTTVQISKDFLTKLGPAADRLNLSNNVLTTIVAAVANNGGGDIQHLSLSKSTARRHRAAIRSETAKSIKKQFSCSPGQINFDGKLLPHLGGFGKVNRLAVVLVQEE